ncbi:hypothetical protein BC831DRAFT_488107 [Entophlyctis helioformis]|nr:hypothetical protein BC831DRAFT_488107 [Entophlyctis helioformis]
MSQVASQQTQANRAQEQVQKAEAAVDEAHERVLKAEAAVDEAQAAVTRAQAAADEAQADVRAAQAAVRTAQAALQNDPANAHLQAVLDAATEERSSCREYWTSCREERDSCRKERDSCREYLASCREERSAYTRLDQLLVEQPSGSHSLVPAATAGSANHSVNHIIDQMGTLCLSSRQLLDASKPRMTRKEFLAEKLPLLDGLFEIGGTTKKRVNIGKTLSHRLVKSILKHLDFDADPTFWSMPMELSLDGLRQLLVAVPVANEAGVALNANTILKLMTPWLRSGSETFVIEQPLDASGRPDAMLLIDGVAALAIEYKSPAAVMASSTNHPQLGNSDSNSNSNNNNNTANHSANQIAGYIKAKDGPSLGILFCWSHLWLFERRDGIVLVSPPIQHDQQLQPLTAAEHESVDITTDVEDHAVLASRLSVSGALFGMILEARRRHEQAGGMASQQQVDDSVDATGGSDQGVPDSNSGSEQDHEDSASDGTHDSNSIAPAGHSSSRANTEAQEDLDDGSEHLKDATQMHAVLPSGLDRALLSAEAADAAEAAEPADLTAAAQPHPSAPSAADAMDREQEATLQELGARHGLTFGSKLGSGRDAVVYDGVYDGQPCAIKTMMTSKRLDVHDLKFLWKHEARVYSILAELQGVRIPRLFKAIWDDTASCGILILSRGTPQRTAWTIADRALAAEAMAAVHAKGVMHADVAKRNFVFAEVDGQRQAWLIDFQDSVVCADEDPFACMFMDDDTQKASEIQTVMSFNCIE